MIKRFSNKIEFVANIAIILVAIIIVFVFIQPYVFTNRSDVAQNLVGTQIALPGLDWSANKQTVLLALQKGCPYCTASAPFYQRLLQETSQSKDVRVIAVLPQTVAEAQDYLKGLGVNPDEIKQAALSSIGVKGTPTVMFINQKGVISDVWRGKQPPEKELEILVKLRKCRVFAECG